MIALTNQNKKAFKTEIIEDGIMADFDKDDKIIGFEVLDLSKRHSIDNVPIKSLGLRGADLKKSGSESLVGA